MAAYSDQYALARNPEFLRRVQMSLIKASQSVLIEDSGTASHAERVILAERILGGQSESVSVQFALTVVTADVTISGTPLNGSTTDANIDSAVAALYTAFALATT